MVFLGFVNVRGKYFIDFQSTIQAMEPMNRQNIIILAAATGTILVVFASYLFYNLYMEYNKPRIFYDNGVSDQEYIAITDQTLEAKRFLEKFPNAVTTVDRSGALAVDYRVESNSTANYLRLRIFIDWRTNKTSDMFIDNSGTYITENLLNYIDTVKFP